MSTETRVKSVPTDTSSSSSESEHEGSSTPRPTNEKKAKRLVKKKGDMRKNDSTAKSKLQIPQINKISKKFKNMKIKTEKKDEADDPKENNNVGDDKTVATTSKIRNLEEKSKNEKEKKIVKNDEAVHPEENNYVVGDDKTEATTSKIRNLEVKLKKGKETNETEEAVTRGDEEESKVNSEKSLNPKKQPQDKKKTEEQRKRDRETARFAKAVARFSSKFSKAAKDLGIIQREFRVCIV